MLANLSKRFATKCRVEGLNPASGLRLRDMHIDTGGCSMHLVHGIADEAIYRGVCVKMYVSFRPSLAIFTPPGYILGLKVYPRTH